MTEAQSSTEHFLSMPKGLSPFIPESLSILVVGDLILDEFIMGDVSRVAPDIPIPVLNSVNTLKSPGGAANLAQNLASLGPKILVELLGTIGDDDAGSSLMRLLSELGIRVGDIQVITDRPTTHKWRVVAQMGHQLLRIDREATEHIPDHVQEALLTAVRRKLPHIQGIVCSDYNKGCLTPFLLQGIIREARLVNIPVIIDPKWTDASRYAGASILTPNIAELEMLTMKPVRPQEALDAAAYMLLRETGADAILVTRGEAGVSIYARNGFHAAISAHLAEGNVCDVNGAGDTFAAAFSLAYCGGANLLQSAQIANIAAGLVVRKRGTATISRAELLHQLAPKSPDSPSHPAFQGTEGKTVTLDSLLPQLDSARKSGFKIIFTNGCFDLLHAGHVQSLEAAKMLGGILVVGLNTDASVTRLKGKKRPVIVQARRARVLSALACVDFVVLFDDPTPIVLIAKIRPDVLVKGADYVGKEVVGRELVEGWGGRVELLPLLEGVSTTGILERAVDMEVKV